MIDSSELDRLIERKIALSLLELICWIGLFSLALESLPIIDDGAA